MLKNIKSKQLSMWLQNNVNESKDKKYRHRLLKENKDKRVDIIEELRDIVSEAHDDARLRLRKVVDTSLHPLENEESFDPAQGYPELFDLTTLKGYFGEVFAGLIAENFSPFGEDWRVPVFSFRYHEIAFDQLEMYRLTGEKLNTIPGRTGDDCLAFVMDKSHKINKVLFCEAKCTANHKASMISDAHIKISSMNLIPVEVRRLIDTLKDYEDSESRKWVKSLRELYIKGTQNERYDLVSYVCGKSPVRSKTRKSWIPSNMPHPSYEGKRKLEAVEVHLNDVEDLIREVYRKVD
ncbi:hypothetical protein [Priestia flexa]|uniref:hypothetical protein n=1 Tax=Priestia flexa TaxID=86664 RepID=UPI00077C300B|nr:hypothetical protein [Priestia flexa]MED4588237.1 hypothetical protein [Priestia flexa]